MARLSDAEWMRRFATRIGSQKEAARLLGVSASTVGKVIRGQRSGERYREAARAGATGRRVVAPAPTAKTPRRVRQPVRRPAGGGRSRVITRSTRVAARELRADLAAGRRVSEFTVTVTRATRSARYTHKNDQGWSGPLRVEDPTLDELNRMAGGQPDDVLDVLRERYPWLGGGTVSALTWED